MRSLFLPLSRNSPSVNSRPSSKNDVCSTSLWEVCCGQTDFLLGYLSCLSPPSKTTVAWTSELSHSPCGWHEKERTQGEKRMFSKSENRLKWTLFRKRFVIIRFYEILKFWKLNICSTCPDVPVCVCVSSDSTVVHQALLLVCVHWFWLWLFAWMCQTVTGDQWWELNVQP